MSQLGITVLTIGLVANAFAASSRAEPVNPQARECVGYLLTIKTKRIDQGIVLEATYIATAFAASYTYEEGPTVQFLVTARHAVIDPQGNAQSLLVQFPHSEPGSISLTPLSPRAWLFHAVPDEIDIAVYPGLPDHANYRRVQSDFWVTDDLLAEKGIREGDEAFYTALMPHYPGRAIQNPLGASVVENLVDELSPVTRFAHLALVRDSILYEGKRLVFLDADNMRGHSGSPVFLWATAARTSSEVVAGPRIFGLYGVVSNVLEWARKLRFVEVGKTPADYRSGGVTGVVPVRYLREILEGEQARRVFVDQKKQ